MAGKKETRYVDIDGEKVDVAGCKDCPVVIRYSIPSDEYDDDGYPEEPEVYYICNHPKGPGIIGTADGDKDGTFPEKCPLRRISAAPPKRAAKKR